MKNIVKYSNFLHEINFNHFSDKEQNLLFKLFEHFCNSETEEIHYDIKSVFKSSNINKRERLAILANLNKLYMAPYIDTAKDVMLHMFKSIVADCDRLKVVVNPSFCTNYLKKQIKNWTSVEIGVFVNINSIYVKTIYRYLRQYRSTGIWHVEYGQFIEMLKIPLNYKPCEIDQRVLKPAIKKLSTIFQNLKIEKMRDYNDARRIATIKFTFDIQAETKKETSKQTEAKKEQIKNEVYDAEKMVEQLHNEIYDESNSFSIKIDKADEEIDDPYIARLRWETAVYNATHAIDEQVEAYKKQGLKRLQQYIGCYFYIKDDVYGGRNPCKITLAVQKLDDDSVDIYAINMDTGRSFEMHFQNEQHMKNALKLI